jgi:hypothetical protein
MMGEVAIAKLSARGNRQSAVKDLGNHRLPRFDGGDG